MAKAELRAEPDTDYIRTEITHTVHREVTDPMLSQITVTYTWNSDDNGWQSRTKVTYLGRQIAAELPDWVTAFVNEHRPDALIPLIEVGRRPAADE